MRKRQQLRPIVSPPVNEIIAQALPVNRVPEMYDLAKRLMDTATIVGALRRHGFEITKAASVSVETALEESISLQSHYAGLLNDYDGGTRKQFSCAQEWLDVLAGLGITNPFPKHYKQHALWNRAHGNLPRDKP